MIHEGTAQMNTVAIFLKHPTPGKVKTRLARQLGDGRAAEIYSAMAKEVVKSVASGARIFYDPPEMEKEVKEWLGDFEGDLSPQNGNSLGERMSNAIGLCLREGSKKIVVIGTDCPDVTPAIIADAFERLNGADVVIGPCEDGGYYLIGMTRLHSGLFCGIEWSTNSVTARTLAKAKALSLKVSMLQTLRDIDEADDLGNGFESRIEDAL